MREQTDLKLERVVKRLLCWNSHSGKQAGVLRHSVKSFLLKFDQRVAIRYYPLVKYIQSSGSENSSILEVGPGSAGITRYLKREVVGADINFEGPDLGYLKCINCSATELKIPDQQFDFVVSVDTIEHLSPTDRIKAVNEMVRVARRYILIAVPCGSAAERWEKRAKLQWEKKLCNCRNEKRRKEISRRGYFLKEHERHGLPSEQDIRQIISDSLAGQSCLNSQLYIDTINNESVVVWYLLALAGVRLSQVRWLVTNIISLPLGPVLRNVSWVGHYRKVFIIKKESN